VMHNLFLPKGHTF